MNLQASPSNHSAYSSSNLSINESETGLAHSQSLSSIGAEFSNRPCDSNQHLPGETGIKLPLPKAERPITARKKTPVRAVFDDLTTAHSLITSGSARSSSYLKRKNAAFEGQSEVGSIALQDIAPRGFQDNSSSLSLPTLPARAYLSNSSLDGDHDRCLTPEREVPFAMQSGTPDTPKQRTYSSLQASSRIQGKDRFTSTSASDLTDRPFDDHEASHSKDENEEGTNNMPKHESLCVKKCIHRSQSETAIPQNPRGEKHKDPNIANCCTEDDVLACVFNPANNPDKLLPRDHQDSQAEVDDLDMSCCANAEVDRPHCSTDDNPCFVTQLSFVQSCRRSRRLSDITTKLPNNPVSFEGNTPESSCKGPSYFGQEDEFGEASVSMLDTALTHHAASSHGLLGSPKRCQPTTEKPREEVNNKADTNGSPPKFALPPQPKAHLPTEHRAIVASQEFGYSSSYGDTRNLLNLTETSNSAQRNPTSSCSNGGHSLLADGMTSGSDGNSQELIVRLNSNNPFRSYLNETACRVFEDARDEQRRGITNAGEGPSLEREISMALRRASGYSAYDNESIFTLPLDQGEMSPAEAPPGEEMKPYIQHHVEATPPLDLKFGPVGQVIAPQIGAFYNQHAISSKWVASRRPNIIRVPIRPAGLIPNSPPVSPQNDVGTELRREQTSREGDRNDWETVSESIFGRQYDAGFIGGSFRQTGSSIANTSDDGSGSSPILDIEPYSSTDRITQHPANIQYFTDYRQKDLKETCTPAFPPVSREYKINGYLADSKRPQPHAAQLYRAPNPLERTHTNPFRYPPGITLSVNAQGHQHTDGAPSITQGSHLFEERDIADQRAQRMSEGTSSRSSHDSESTNDTGEPGPMIVHKTNRILGVNCCDNQATSRDMITTVAPIQSRYSNSLMRCKGKSHGSAPLKKHEQKVLEWQEKSENEGFAVVRTYGGRRNINQPRNRKPLVKGPPGAFYQGLRAVSDQKRPSWGYQQDRSASNCTKDLPTNGLRPLSLLADRRPLTPVDQITPAYSTYLEDSFSYRSPLAPPKRDSWQQLYSPSEMERIRAAAKVDGVFNSQIQLSTRSTGVREISGSQKQLLEAPRLAIFSRRPSTLTGLIHKKKNISLTVLCLCAAFPPMLILYGNGALDGIMSWWTKGQCSDFGLKYKRLARSMVYAWILVITIALAVFLVVWFVKLHPHSAGV